MAELDAVVIEAELGLGAVKNASMFGFDVESDEGFEEDVIKVVNLDCVVSIMIGVLAKLIEVVADVMGSLVVTGYGVSEKFERAVVSEVWVQVAVIVGAVAGEVAVGCREAIVFIVERCEVVAGAVVEVDGDALILEDERIEAVAGVAVVVDGESVDLEKERVVVVVGLGVVVGRETFVLVV